MYDLGTDPGYTEPPEHERVFYKHIQTGDLGYAVEKEGKPYIKYDRPNENRVVPFNQAHWMQEEKYRPIPDAQMVQVAFEADRRLLVLLGYHNLARREWQGLTDSQRKKWLETGPQKPDIRRKLYWAIKEVLQEL